ncbi:GL21894 [Drosophila persimilis]|uniref:GL21894 n=1 Tax=Drosophila persimilis TaxID=7234 RepID=B4GE37_DROPE|nr:GL21894 [Drosophila persimilis]
MQRTPEAVCPESVLCIQNGIPRRQKKPQEIGNSEPWGLRTRRPEAPQGNAQSCNELLTSVVTSQMVYAEPFWAKAAKELIRERKETHDATQDGAAEVRSQAEIKDAARRISLDRWQSRWDHTPKGRWTHTLIPSIACWVERKRGQVNCYLTQALSGHGCFRGYLKRFCHKTEGWSPECGTGMEEDARHVLFDCHRFDHERQTLEAAAGSRVSSETLVRLMLPDPKVWKAAAEFASSDENLGHPHPGGPRIMCNDVDSYRVLQPHYRDEARCTSKQAKSYVTAFREGHSVQQKQERQRRSRSGKNFTPSLRLQEQIIKQLSRNRNKHSKNDNNIDISIITTKLDKLILPLQIQAEQNGKPAPAVIQHQQSLEDRLSKIETTMNKIVAGLQKHVHNAGHNQLPYTNDGCSRRLDSHYRAAGRRQLQRGSDGGS